MFFRASLKLGSKISRAARSQKRSWVVVDGIRYRWNGRFYAAIEEVREPLEAAKNPDIEVAAVAAEPKESEDPEETPAAPPTSKPQTLPHTRPKSTSKA